MKRFFAWLCIIGLLSCQSLLADLNSGLVAYYPFKGNANDASGNGNNGIVNGATLTTDRFGSPNSAYFFDGISAYIRVPESSSLDLTNDFTLSAWINCQYLSPSASEDIITKHMSGPETDGTWIFQLYQLGTIDFGASPFFGYYTYSSASLSLDHWHHVVFSYVKNTSAWQIYIDGVLNSSGIHTYDIEINSHDLYIGVEPHPTAGFVAYFNGYIDDVRFYNRALSDSEVTELYDIENNDIMAVSTTQAQLPSYGNLPVKESGKDSLVVITHGWTSTGLYPVSPPDPAWIDQMSNAIVSDLVAGDQSNWQVFGYRWVANSWTLHSQDALVAGNREGVRFPQAIVLPLRRRPV